MTQNTRTEPAKPTSDLRVRRTQKHLKEALVALTLEKGYAAVAVQDIAERAMVNRATFYRHYEDKYDLVRRCLQDLLAEMPTADLLEVARAYPAELPPATVQFFRHISRHVPFYRAMLGRGGMPSFKEQLQASIERGVRQELGALGERCDPTLVPLDLVPNFIAGAAVGVLAWWLEQGDEPLPPEAMARAFATLVTPGVRAALRLHPG